MLNQLLSNRVEKTPATEVSADRYEYLTLSEAEPDLGVPAGNSYILASTTTGTRSWIDPTANLTAPGSDKQVIFNNAGVLGAAIGLVYDTATGRVGIGVTSPSAELELAETWNNAGTAFTLLKANITDTASASTSLIADFQVSSSTKVYIDKTGLINATGFLIGATTPGAVTGAHGFTRNGNNLYVYTVGTLNYNFSTSSFNTRMPIGFGTSLTNPDTFVLREAANIIAQRNGLNTQVFRLYNTYTDASNYERATVGWNSNVLEIGTEAAGTGAVRNINIVGGNVGIGISPSNKFQVGQNFIVDSISALTTNRHSSSYIASFQKNGTAKVLISSANNAGPTGIVFQGAGYRGQIYAQGYDHYISPNAQYGNVNIVLKGENEGTYTTNVGVGTTTPSAKLDVLGDIEINSNVNLNSEATTLATTTKTQVASFPVASFRSGKLIVQAYDSVTGEVQISELLVAHNGTTASATEYGIVYTGSNPIVSYDVDITAGNVRLMATRATASSTQYKISETLMVA